jgi:DNA-binding response OmpR family regulator
VDGVFQFVKVLRSLGRLEYDRACEVVMSQEASPSEPTISVLFVEDDERLVSFTSEYLTRHGLIMTHAPDGLRGQALALKHHYDVILLDVMLPGRSGLEVCRAIRERSDVPIIILTARGEEADKVLGLEGGADDYVPKPFSARELLARIRSVVRRARGRVGPPARILRAGELIIDPINVRATLRGAPLALTTYEFTLLRVLAERAGQVLSRERLLDLSRGSTEEAFDRSIDVHISRLRQKLGDNPRDPHLLKTIRGAGYVLTPNDQDA